MNNKEEKVFITIGEILETEFMKPYNISAKFLADSIFVHVSRIQDILHNRRAITVNTSIRLGKFFGVSSTYFINIQIDLDSRKAILENEEAINKIIPFRCA